MYTRRLGSVLGIGWLTGLCQKINTVNLVYGIRVLLQTRSGKRTMLIPTSRKWESTGVCKYIGLQPPDRPSRASNSTLSMHIVWVTYYQLTRRFSYLPPLISLMEGIHKLVRLYSSLALLYLRNLARGICRGRCTHYKHGHPTRKSSDVAV